MTLARPHNAKKAPPTKINPIMKERSTGRASSAADQRLLLPIVGGELDACPTSLDLQAATQQPDQLAGGRHGVVQILVLTRRQGARQFLGQTIGFLLIDVALLLGLLHATEIGAHVASRFGQLIMA